ncbi:hypothetical protein [Agreia bicolorata]|uniref:Uncharacterized protein n=1 Tax=Agreia bicolorata TaxID=110935 RepID=A0ABR5CHH8_9MICO|nr:hypothetical protein [Agreia bicolorata]KJC65071.1 hypothetical protein TZ00_05795 [Agreia bicolorata]
MAQVTIYARRHCIETRRAAISDAVHGAVMAALAYPAEKRTETPKMNWGIRGVNGADLALGYRVDA